MTCEKFKQRAGQQLHPWMHQWKWGVRYVTCETIGCTSLPCNWQAPYAMQLHVLGVAWVLWTDLERCPLFIGHCVRSTLLATGSWSSRVLNVVYSCFLFLVLLVLCFNKWHFIIKCYIGHIMLICVRWTAAAVWLCEWWDTLKEEGKSVGFGINPIIYIVLGMCKLFRRWAGCCKGSIKV